jgi:hypothetical protein
VDEAALARALQSPAVRGALAAAQRLAVKRSQGVGDAPSQASGRAPGQARGGKASPGSDAGPTQGITAANEVGLGEAGDATATGAGLQPGERARLFRLPPSVREPLLQGMEEPAPPGYRGLVEAYYRQLSEDLRE